jgi:hypothetical protein
MEDIFWPFLELNPKEAQTCERFYWRGEFSGNFAIHANGRPWPIAA